MKYFLIVAVSLLIGALLPVTSNAATLVANEPATIYYTTNGSSPVISTPISDTSATRGTSPGFATTSYSSSSTFTNGGYTLSTTPPNWVGTDADRLKAASSYYASTYGDESTVTYTLPWSFTFYGQSYSQIIADTNGNIWFQSNSGPKHSFNLASTGQGPVIAVWNNDLSSYFYGGVFVQNKTDPERIVIEWQTETYTDEGNYLTNNVEAVLFPNGDIRFDYNTFNAAIKKDFGSGISTGDGTNSLSITANFDYVYNLAESSFLFTPATTNNLTVNLSGTGQGTVTSNPAGISCPGTCSATFPTGTQITLHPAPDLPSYSTFTGWSNGVCSGTGDCVLTLNADSSVTAVFDFDSAHQVKATGGSSGYFSSIQSAYNTVATATTLNLWAIVYPESLTFNRPVSVTLEGGYDSGYNTIIGGAVLNGSLTISDGTITVSGIVIR